MLAMPCNSMYIAMLVSALYRHRNLRVLATLVVLRSMLDNQLIMIIIMIIMK